MGFTPKVWADSPATTTPITAAALQDLEARLAAYADGLIVVEAWHIIGGSGEPAFQNSWVNTPSTSDAAFYKDPFGIVHLKGFVQSGTMGAAIFTLPTGYRPSTITSLLCYSVSASSTATFGRVDIDSSTGTVIPASGIGSSSNARIILDGMTFRP